MDFAVTITRLCIYLSDPKTAIIFFKFTLSFHAESSEVFATLTSLYELVNGAIII